LTVHRKLAIIENNILKGKGMSSQKEKEEWADEHAHRIQQLFEQWQKPLGIDSGEYFRYLKKDLVDLCEDSLKKSLIESIS
jgi:ribosomal protein L32E